MLFRMYSPELGVSKHQSMFIKVDLPEPDGPIKATYSFLWIFKETDLSACISSVPMVYLRAILLKLIISSIDAMF